SVDVGPATSDALDSSYEVAVDSARILFIADTYNQRIRRVDAATGVISTVAGNGYRKPDDSLYGGYSGDGGPATSAALNRPWSVAVDGSGNLFIADLNNGWISRVNADTGIINTVAVNGIP